MTDAELQRLENLEKAATPGPWQVFLPEPGEIFGRRVAVISHKKGPTGIPMVRFAAVTWVNDDGGNADAICATAARNALPELIAEIRRLRAERQTGIGRATWSTGYEGKEGLTEDRSGLRFLPLITETDGASNP